MSTRDYLKIKAMSPQFVVSDLHRSVEFYTKELGFAIDFSFEDFYIGIAKSGHTIHLKSGDPEIEKREYKEKSEHLDLVISVEDIESLYQHMTHQPVNIVQHLREMPYGREFYITDPDGYRIAFIE